MVYALGFARSVWLPCTSLHYRSHPIAIIYIEINDKGLAVVLQMHVGPTSLFNNEDQCEKYCQTITVLLGLLKMLYNGANMRNEQLFRWNRLWPSVVPLNINKLLCQFLVPTGFRLCQSPLSFSLSDRLLAMCSEKNCYKFIHWTFKNIPIAVDQSNYLTLYSFA